ncbi:MAG: ABC transporter ATP-binding protein [Anaerolineaceae bacterium]|nr:ABC transporter ATP-binding protein [Anaerolineaceae bacterium]
MTTRATSPPLLELRDVTKQFYLYQGHIVRRQVGRIQAVNGVSLTVYPGENFGLVGESGCGKSTLARVILRLLPPTSGQVWFAGQDITTAQGAELHAVRRQLQLIFQDAHGSLNPRMRVGAIIEEPLKLFRMGDPSARRKRVDELLEIVGLSALHHRRHPADLSGGERQRVGIARALAVNPQLIVCDEPVSSLDVSIRAQIITLLKELQRQFGLTYLFISHDLSVIKHICHRLAVMYLGRIVELGSTEQIFTAPSHPYTEALLSAIPLPDPQAERQRQRILLPGEPPDPAALPAGCHFHPRCQLAQPKCREAYPISVAVAGGHSAHCFFAAPFPTAKAKDGLVND